MSTESEAEYRNRDKNRSVRAGGGFYIVKPLQPNDLMEDIYMVLGMDLPRGTQV